MNIVREELSGYFESDRSAEQAVQAIQKRVQLYLDEKQWCGDSTRNLLPLAPFTTVRGALTLHEQSSRLNRICMDMELC